MHFFAILCSCFCFATQIDGDGIRLFLQPKRPKHLFFCKSAVTITSNSIRLYYATVTWFDSRVPYYHERCEPLAERFHLLYACYYNMLSSLVCSYAWCLVIPICFTTFQVHLSGAGPSERGAPPLLLRSLGGRQPTLVGINLGIVSSSSSFVRSNQHNQKLHLLTR